MCKKIDHFPEDADYEADAAEYLLRKSDMNTSMRRVLVFVRTCGKNRESLKLFF